MVQKLSTKHSFSSCGHSRNPNSKGSDYMYVGLLPKRYEPKKVEEEIFRWWKENRIYEKVKRSSENGEKFYFLDGPPYVTSSIHLGTAWNKVIKDSVLRYKRMRGFKVRDRPGFDMHGLPIEVMVEKSLGNKEQEGDRGAYRHR